MTQVDPSKHIVFVSEHTHHHITAVILSVRPTVNQKNSELSTDRPFRVTDVPVVYTKRFSRKRFPKVGRGSDPIKQQTNKPRISV